MKFGLYNTCVWYNFCTQSALVLFNNDLYVFRSTLEGTFYSGNGLGELEMQLLYIVLSIRFSDETLLVYLMTNP